MKPGVEMLRDLPIVSALGPAGLSALNEKADFARVGPDETLFSAGDVLDDVTFLVSGQVAATRPSRKDNDTLIDVLMPVQPLCLATALLERRALHGVLTVTSARLVIVPLSDLRRELDASPAASAALRDYVLGESYRARQELVSLKLTSSVRRLAEYLLTRVSETETGPARFVLPFEKRLLAAGIGCSQENLSRAFAALRRVGVETRQGVVVIRDIPGLRAYAAGTSTGT
jgi:CRP-like cAMP-binding protein